jgi:hypothetical protein
MDLVNGVKRIYDRYMIAVDINGNGELDNSDFFKDYRLQQEFNNLQHFWNDSYNPSFNEWRNDVTELLRPSLPPNSELLRMAGEPVIHCHELLRGSNIEP